MLKTLSLVLVFLVAVVVPAAAQTGVPTVPPNTAFSIAADHNANETGKEATGYRLKVDGVLTRTATVAEVWVAGTPGTVTFAFASGLPKGDHVIEIEAFNESGGATSDPFAMKSQPGNPSKPWNLRIVITVGGGGDD